MITLNLNYLALLVAVLVNMGLGALWYSPILFGKIWAKLVGIKQSDMGKMTNGYLVTTLGSIIQVFILANMIVWTGISGVMFGLELGFIVWLGFVAVTSIADVVFAKKPWKLWLINNGYYLVVLMINGALLSYWQ